MPTSLSCLVACRCRRRRGHPDLITANADPLAGAYQGIITVYLTNNGDGIFGSNAAYTVGQKTASARGGGHERHRKNGFDLRERRRQQRHGADQRRSRTFYHFIHELRRSRTVSRLRLPTWLSETEKPDVICANSWNDTLTVLLNSPATAAPESSNCRREQPGLFLVNGLGQALRCNKIQISARQTGWMCFEWR